MSGQREFQLLIKPVGADCNLRCEYCFYLRAGELYPELKRHIMPDPVLETVIRGLLSYRFPQTVFAWQGGEPTLAGLDFFRRVVELEQQYGASGQSVGNALQTNGILINDAWCRLFRDYQFLIGLSLDGPEEIHNRFRRNIGGRGTWHKVMAAAQRMNAHQVAFNILCVVNTENVRLGADLLRWFVEQGFIYIQFIPCVEKWSPHSVSAEALGDFLCDTFDYWSKEGFGRVSVRDFDAMLTAHVNAGPPLCIYGRTCNNYIVVEHNGDVYPCDFFVYEKWKLGNVMDRPLASFLDSETYKRFAYQKNKVPACRACPYRAWCHGGCQKDRLFAGTVSDPTALCAAYRKFFAHALPRLRALGRKVVAGRV